MPSIASRPTSTSAITSSSGSTHRARIAEIRARWSESTSSTSRHAPAPSHRPPEAPESSTPTSSAAHAPHDLAFLLTEVERLRDMIQKALILSTSELDLTDYRHDEVRQLQEESQDIYRILHRALNPPPPSPASEA